MIVGLATATMVESTMIMKNPSIIAHSAAQGFPEKLSPVIRLVAVLIDRTSFRLPRISRRIQPALFTVCCPTRPLAATPGARGSANDESPTGLSEVLGPARILLDAR